MEVLLPPQPADIRSKTIRAAGRKLAGLMIRPPHNLRRPSNLRTGSLSQHGYMLLLVHHGIQHRSARLTWFGHAQQDLEQQQPALEVHGDEKVLLGLRAAVLAQ